MDTKKSNKAQPLDKPLAAPISDFSMKIVGNMMENYQTD